MHMRILAASGSGINFVAPGSSSSRTENGTLIQKCALVHQCKIRGLTMFVEIDFVLPNTIDVFGPPLLPVSNG
jgi:hypothetical protein